MNKLVVILMVLLLVACSSPSQGALDEQEIGEAIAGTLTAMPQQPTEDLIQPTMDAVQTEIAQATKDAAPTVAPPPTETPKPTNTPEPTATPTPDLRIVIGDPDDYILVPEELPDKLILGRGNSSPHLNSEILSARGVEDGKKYLDATGRLGGWIIWYYRASDIPIAPEWIRSYIVMYDSVEGPKVAKSPEFDWFDEDYEILDFNLELGEWNQVSIKREMRSNGKYYVIYAIEFYYRNVWAEVLGEGWESDVQHDYIENAARAVLTKLQEGPLSSPAID